MRSNAVRQVVSILAVVALGGGAVLAYRSFATNATPAQLEGVVRQTEIRIAPDTSGRFTTFRVSAGQEVHQGDVLAVLDAPELAAALEEAKANAASATADRANVLAGTRREEVDIAAQNVRIAQANLALAKQQLARATALSARDFASRQRLDESTAALRKAEAATSASWSRGPEKRFHQASRS